MTESEPQRIAGLLGQALAHDARDRPEFVSNACEGDVLLQSRIERLLAISEEDVGASGPTVARPPAGDGTSRPERIGHYHVKRAIGTGGMGVVYEAVQEHPHRTVALKIMRRGIASRSALRRFEYESQILARLRHPNIAQVYEAGTHDDGAGGVPFFAMEYIPGAKTLTEFVSARKLDLRRRLELFVKICHAVQHGHQKGIIHRDLKPGNILVDTEGEPKIIDFGVARATDSDMAVTTLQTDVGQLIGTLQYMSPEQCNADPHDLDSRSDVYALGVVLYELLCGDLPYDVSAISLVEATRVVREQTPRRPSTINRTLRGDLETIVLKALEKDRTQRYQSSADLAADIGRFLHDQPIVARPPSAMYQLRKFARRNKLLVGGVATLIVVLAAATVVSTGFALSEAEQRQAAATERDIARAVNAFLNEDLLAAVAPSAQAGRGRDVLMREVLDEAAKRIEDAAAPGGQFEGKPLVEASIRFTVGETYRLLGEYAAAEPHLERAAQLRRRELGEEHPDTLWSRKNLGLLYSHQGRYEEAGKLYRETLKISERVLGPVHETTLWCMNNLGVVYLDQHHYGKAEDILRETLELSRGALGDQARVTLSAMNNLAFAYMEQGLVAEAKLLREEHFEICRRVYRPDQPETWYAMGNLARLYTASGRDVDAMRLYLELLEIQERVLGAEHESTLITMSNLAFSYERQRRFEDAEPLRVDALAGFRMSLTTKHPRTLRVMVYLAKLYTLQKRYDEALPLYLEALEIQERDLREHHPNTLSTMTHLARMYRLQERYGEAEVWYLRALEISEEMELGEDHRYTVSSLRGLRDVYVAEERVEEARPHVRRLLDSRRKLAERADATPINLNEYAWLLLTCEPADLRDPQAALPLAVQANDMTENQHPQLLDTLSHAYHLTGDTAKAIENQKKAIALLPPGPSGERTQFELNLADFEAAASESGLTEELVREER